MNDLEKAEAELKRCQRIFNRTVVDSEIPQSEHRAAWLGLRDAEAAYDKAKEQQS